MGKEYVKGGGITWKVMEMSEHEMLDVQAGSVKGERQQPRLTPLHCYRCAFDISTCKGTSIGQTILQKRDGLGPCTWLVLKHEGGLSQ